VTRPLPRIDAWGRPYWDAAHDGRLLIQRCETCGRHVFYPRLECPHCGSHPLAWVEATGRGTIYSFSVVRSYAPSPFADLVPFVIAIVELEEGVRMMANIIDCDLDRLRCDLPVAVTFETITEEVTLPQFRPA